MTQHWFHAHTHSQYSVKDALSPVEAMVAKAAKDGQPAYGLTDHGNMSGVVDLYKAGKKHGVQVFPGVEGYLVSNISDTDAKRHHLGLLARNYNGYKGLVSLVSATHTRPAFHRFPRMDMTMLQDFAAKYGNDVILTTGCFFGLVQQTLVNQGEQAMKGVLEWYAQLFPHTFVEVQHHNIQHNDLFGDDEMVNALIAYANRLGLPVMATQDAHYLDQGDKSAHNLMKRIVYGGEDDEFPGDAFHLASAEWVAEHYEPKQWDKAIEGARHMLGLNDFSLPALDTFTFHTPRVSSLPDARVKKLCAEGMARHGFDKKPEYKKRLDHELSIIKDLGIANYLLLWEDIVRWCKSERIFIEARGSANASLVCYVLGITQIDPLKWDLMFERFLSRDRKKPPDIDMDVEDRARGRLMQYIERKYKTIQIGTYNSLGETYNRDGESTGRGSTLVTYLSWLRKTEPDFKAKYGHIESLDDVKRVSMSDYKALRRLGMHSARRGYGTHAAGLLLESPTQPISDYVPIMLVASSDTPVTQFTMKAVELLGYLKLDVLGVRYLTAMKRCQELIGRADPLDFEWIPEDDKAALKELNAGKPNTGIFQFDGYAMAKGGQKMRVRSTMDSVIAGALFRPAVMDQHLDDLYIERRNDAAKRKAVQYPHPAFEKNLKSTHGVVVFQEQVLQIMRDLGMTFEGINTFFDAVKDSASGSGQRNQERFDAVYKEFEQLCADNGIADVERAWSYVDGYVTYGFNKGHATGYGVRSYRGAYLKAHYPLEYMTALLEVSVGHGKEQDYVNEARRIGLRVMQPDVNVSGLYYTMDKKRGAILRGLSTVKGVGDAAAVAIVEERDENGPYKSLDDMVARLPARPVSGGKAYLKEGTPNGVLGQLLGAGVLDSIMEGR